MENYLLYEDNEQKIEIAEWFHKLRERIRVKTIVLDRQQLMPILSQVLKNLQSYGIYKLNNPVLIGSIPIVEYGKFLEMKEPYGFLSNVLNYLAQFPAISKTEEQAKEIIEAIECFSDEEIKFYSGILMEKPQGVQGWIVTQSKECDYILLYGFEEFKEEDTNEELY